MRQVAQQWTLCVMVQTSYVKFTWFKEIVVKNYEYCMQNNFSTSNNHPVQAELLISFISEYFTNYDKYEQHLETLSTKLKENVSLDAVIDKVNKSILT